MYSQMHDMLARARAAEISRASAPPGVRRNSLRIVLGARRARRQSPAG